ncbi:MAG: L-aspartate oxidase [Thermoanaerobaculales bacterium]
MTFSELRSAEVVVLGGGAAGLMAALHAHGREVVLVTKSAFGKGGSSVLAQGGVAAAVGGDDSPARHAEDTVAAGAGLCDPEVVWRVTGAGPERIGELLALGARFDRRADGRLALGREGAHSRRRVAHAAGDATGAELVRALASAVRAADHIRIDQNVLAIDLVLDRGAVVGVLAVDREGLRILYAASEVVLATGGIGRLWRSTTNPEEATGDGLAMAIRAGACAADFEFVQFHPTTLAVGGSPVPLLTEALRGEGAVLVDESGNRFLFFEHPQAELAPRDVVARAIWRRLQAGERVFLDATGVSGRVEERFPTVAGMCRERRLDLGREPVPVTPAAHYHMGGVMTGAEGRTSVPGLWACGEVARTGLHGANRLASNSLLEALVYGAAVGEALTVAIRAPAHPVRVREAANRAAAGIAATPWLNAAPAAEKELETTLRALMWEGVGLERNAAGLRRVAEELAELENAAGPGGGELGNMLLVGRMVVRAATVRTESRGAHYRTDSPRPCACWRQPLVFEGERMLRPQPIQLPAAGGQ